MMEKDITFKHNSCLKLSNSMQNRWQPSALHKCEAIIRFINKPLRMCRRKGVSIHNRYRYLVSDSKHETIREKNFKDQLFLFF